MRVANWTAWGTTMRKTTQREADRGAFNHALCIRAQHQCDLATTVVRPRFSARYGKGHPPIHGMNPAIRAFCDVVSRQAFWPEDGWMTMDQWKAHKREPSVAFI